MELACAICLGLANVKEFILYLREQDVIGKSTCLAYEIGLSDLTRHSTQPDLRKNCYSRSSNKHGDETTSLLRGVADRHPWYRPGGSSRNRTPRSEAHRQLRGLDDLSTCLKHEKQEEDWKMVYSRQLTNRDPVPT